MHQQASGQNIYLNEDIESYFMLIDDIVERWLCFRGALRPYCLFTCLHLRRVVDVTLTIA